MMEQEAESQMGESEDLRQCSEEGMSTISSSDILGATAPRESTSAQNKPKSGWYPGKYMGRRPPAESNDPHVDEVEGTKQAAEESRQEAMIVKTVRAIRAKFLQRQLVGRIYIYRLSGIIATAITMDITRDDIMHHLLEKVQNSGADSILMDDPLLQAELEGKYRRALSTTDTILNSLERRSLSWKGAEFAHSTLLTRGSTIGVSDPIVGFLALSFTIELSATVHSLLSSRQRYEATRELAACRPSSVDSTDKTIAADAVAMGAAVSVAADPSPEGTDVTEVELTGVSNSASGAVDTPSVSTTTTATTATAATAATTERSSYSWFRRTSSESKPPATNTAGPSTAAAATASAAESAEAKKCVIPGTSDSVTPPIEPLEHKTTEEAQEVLADIVLC